MNDVVIIGAGPAGLALARSLVDRAVDVLVVAPESQWLATYGAWRDDVVDCELGATLDAVVRDSWTTVRVVGRREHLLPRSYVVFDNARLREALANGVTTFVGQVDSVEHSVDASTVRLATGDTLQCRLVVDASGNGAFLARRGEPSGAQTAYGVVLGAGNTAHTAHTAHSVRIRAFPPGDAFTLMDWSNPPTFLYGATFTDGRVLIEETSLFAQPPHGIDQLRQRLAMRLGVDLTSEAVSVERVNIPMGGPLPSLNTRVVGFGAAAGYVHPVTGYSVAASLRAAPRVAEAIRTGQARQSRGADLSRVVWDAVWPQHLRKTRAWHDMGLSVLKSLPSESIPGFFDAFFDLPRHLIAAYLRIDGEPREVQRAMLGVFRRVDATTRLRLMRSPVALLQALVAR